MAQLGGMFDATQVEPQGDYTPIPPGDYTVQIVSSQMVETSNRNASASRPGAGGWATF